MTKAELIEFLKPFSDEIEITVALPNLDLVRCPLPENISYQMQGGIGFILIKLE